MKVVFTVVISFNAFFIQFYAILKGFFFAIIILLLEKQEIINQLNYSC